MTVSRHLHRPCGSGYVDASHRRLERAAAQRAAALASDPAAAAARATSEARAKSLARRLVRMGARTRDGVVVQWVRP